LQVTTVITYRFAQRQLNPQKEYSPTIHFFSGKVEKLCSI